MTIERLELAYELFADLGGPNYEGPGAIQRPSSSNDLEIP